MKTNSENSQPRTSTPLANSAAPFGQAGSPNVLNDSTNHGSGSGFGFVEFSVEEAGNAVAVLEDEGGKTRDQ